MRVTFFLFFALVQNRQYYECGKANCQQENGKKFSSNERWNEKRNCKFCVWSSSHFPSICISYGIGIKCIQCIYCALCTVYDEQKKKLKKKFKFFDINEDILSWPQSFYKFFFRFHLVYCCTFYFVQWPIWCCWYLKMTIKCKQIHLKWICSLIHCTLYIWTKHGAFYGKQRVIRQRISLYSTHSDCIFEIFSHLFYLEFLFHCCQFYCLLCGFRLKCELSKRFSFYNIHSPLNRHKKFIFLVWLLQV